MSDSDADDGGFDREAERERLREKYERDKEKRESTQRMSELLLQGATMTNQHCDTCGNPLFRYQGQTFCPTCQDAAQAGAETEAGGPGDGSVPDAEPAAEAESGTGQGAEPESGPATGAPSAEPDTPSEASDATGAPATETPGAPEPDAARTPASGSTPRPDAEPAPGQSREGAPERRTRGPRGTTGAGAGDSEGVAAARVSLERTIEALAARAEESRDVGQTRELLAATKEAAEALRELDRV